MNKFIAKKNAIWWIVALNLVLSVPSLWVPYYNTDEITNTIFGKFIANGEMGLKDYLGNTYLLTHYLYAATVAAFGWGSLLPIHIIHAIWKSLTIFAFYWTGKELGDRRTGTWAALFYCFASYSYMSKDFHTPSAESFSLLPAVLAAGIFFRALNAEDARAFFLAGMLASVATLFKAPMGITIAALGLTLVVRYRNAVKAVFFSHGGFIFALFFPALLIWPPDQGFKLMFGKVAETNAVYIGAYEGLSYLYWVLKFFIRTALVLGTFFVVTTFALQGVRPLFHLERKHRNYWQKIFFLCTWFLGLWFAVSLGGRIFYHYYVFLLAPLCLLAGTGVKNFNTRLRAFEHHKMQPDEGIYLLKFLRAHILVLLALPTLIFSVEGAFNVSTHAPQVEEVAVYIREHTNPNDRIYVWGNLPQLYFNSKRLPSTTYFWSDILAGTSPGSPAMEYVRATGKTLTVSQQLQKDFQSQVFNKMAPDKLDSNSTLYNIDEDELFTLDELLAHIDQPYWQYVFKDFLTHPPELFLDTSPTNLRGFGFTPITKYELLKRFVLDNYKVETVLDDVIVYRLVRRGSSS